MRRGRPVPKLSLTDQEQESLQGWAGPRKTAPALALHAPNVLAGAEGQRNSPVSATTRNHG
jgi:hypothetical protein